MLDDIRGRHANQYDLGVIGDFAGAGVVARSACEQGCQYLRVGIEEAQAIAVVQQVVGHFLTHCA
ncbi:hypothetical protein D3C76_776120 [compost metagenome]